MQEQYKRCISKVEENRARFASLLNTDQFKSMRKNIIKAITMQVSQISMDATQIKRKVSILLDTFRKAPNEETLAFCLDFICIKFLEQGSIHVSSLHESCFAYARVLVELCIHFPHLTDIMLGHFYEACPFTLPMREIPKQDFSSTSDWLKARSFKKIGSQSNSFETEDKYIDRMSGILLIYAAMTQSSCPNNPHGLDHAWSWIARLLNMPPTIYTSTFLLLFLKVVGPKLQQKYKRQFVKLIKFIREVYFNQLPSSSTASNTRLELFLDELFNHGYVKPLAPETF